jgi:hypothetical protein
MPIKYDDQYVLRPNHKVEWTPAMLKELRKCSHKVEYFAENYYYIIGKNGKQLIDFTGYDFQKRLIKEFDKNRFNVVLSARQMGKCVTEDTIIEVYDEELDKTSKMTIKEFFDLCESHSPS